jgi:hypothetical protein
VLILALAVGLPLTTYAQPSKKEPPLPTAMNSPSGILSYSSDERYQGSSANLISAAYLAAPTDDADTWAGEVSSYIMSERVIDYMEAKFTAAESYFKADEVRNFVYFYGFDVTSQDVRGSSFYGIDQRQELVMRNNMTSALRGYMLGKGLMEYLKTIKVARPYVSTVERVEKASQISVEIKSSNPNEDESVTNWKIKSGPDLGSRTIFAKANKGDWGFELRNSFMLDNFSTSAGHTYYRSYFSLRYLNQSGVVTTGYQYKLAKNLWTRWSTDIPVAGVNKMNRMFQTVSLRHLF